MRTVLPYRYIEAGRLSLLACRPLSDLGVECQFFENACAACVLISFHFLQHSVLFSACVLHVGLDVSRPGEVHENGSTI